ncbi:MAG: bifunctional phosphoglucose/phosphomannose isomerase [Actinomycetia bacterium]|nr:bifunctional phosphoglucose/phosphomannose isomerase [Actinomycetes bacterium]
MPADLHEADSLDMFGATFALPDQIEHAAAVAADVDGLPSGDGATAAIVMGMGGSGIGGDVAAAVAAPDAAVPVLVSKHYECPAWVGPDTVVLASSFSGNTEETVAAATAAAEAGARMVVMASGGELARLADEWGAPLVQFDPAIPMPRAGIGAVSVSPLVVLARMGLLPDVTPQVEAAVSQLRKRASKLEGDDNAAVGLARQIGRTMPLVYGGGVLGEAAAWRWKGQFNENPKVPSWPNRLPELTHNEIAGWAVNGDVTRQVFTLLLLRHDFEHPQVGRRFEIVAEVCDEVVADVISVQAEGEGPLAQFMDLTLFGDVATLHLAIDLGVDPGPIPLLDDIKARLKS